MLADLYADVLRHEGFQVIGQLSYRLHLTLWWNPATDKLIQLVMLRVGHLALVRASKHYFLKSVTAEGETWARDIGQLHDYLEAHFPEVHISFSHFRDVPPELAKAEVDRRLALEAPTRQRPTVESVAELQRAMEAQQRDAQATETLMGLARGEADLLTRYVQHKSRTKAREVDAMQEELVRQRERLGLIRHLQSEYVRKGSAAAFSFAITSHVQVVEEAQRFGDAVTAAVKDVQDMHRYQVSQKLGGGRLNIQVAEAQEPVVAWLEEWWSTAISPVQLQRLRQDFELLRRRSEERLMVTPDEPIVADNGHVRHAEKHVAARFVSDVMHRLDRTEDVGQRAALTPENISPDAMPLTLGHRLDDEGRATGLVAVPLAETLHLLMSGTTGSGKSYLARVLIEEAAAHQGLNVLVLDPRNQSAGLLVAEDRPGNLDRYAEFGLKPDHARGFAFSYFAPGLPLSRPLPGQLATLAKGKSIVSFKGLDDQQRCAGAAEILDAVFQEWSARESDRPRLLVVVDEAQLLVRRRLPESAREAAGAAERALDRIAREGRKFGIVLALISQSMKDFSHELVSLRAMANTKVFLRNSDREIEYAADVVGDGRALVQLPTGTALVHNANWGTLRVRVRPPFSKVIELNEAEIRQVAGDGQRASPATVSGEARRLMAVIMSYAARADAPLNLSRVAALAEIGSKRKLLELVKELEGARLIRTRTLPERGRPRVIEIN